MRTYLSLLFSLFAFVQSGNAFEPINLLGEKFQSQWGVKLQVIKEGEAPILRLENENKTEKLWKVNLKGLEEDVYYAIKGTIKASAGATYRIYVEAPTDEWRSYCNGWEKGDGESHTYSLMMQFKKTIPAPYMILAVEGACEIDISDLAVVVAEDKTKDLAETLQSKGKISLIENELVDYWKFTSATKASGNWRAEVGSQRPSLHIKSTEGEQTWWGYPNLPIKASLYNVTFRVKGTEGLRYHVYIQNNTEGRWQAAGSGKRTALGEWETISFVCNFKEFSGSAQVFLQTFTEGEIEFQEFVVEGGESGSPQ